MTPWPVLAAVPPDQRALVERTLVRHRYRKGAVVFHEGDAGDGLHLIEKGRVIVRVSTPNGDIATLTVLGPGQSFGELALVASHGRRTATIEALEPTETLLLPQAAFADLVVRHPSIQRVLVTILAEQVERLSARVLESLYVAAEVRVLRRVVDLVRAYGGAVPVDLPVTQEALATMAGTTRPTANKVLRQAEQRGHVSLQRGRITVLDVDGLSASSR